MQKKDIKDFRWKKRKGMGVHKEANRSCLSKKR